MIKSTLKHSLFGIVFCAFVLQLSASDCQALLVIDNFNTGYFFIESANRIDAPPQSPFVNNVGINNAALGGYRETWVRKGLDNDPAKAKLNDGLLTFWLDNDECQGGLNYYYFSEIDSLSYDQIIFDIIYGTNDNRELAAAGAWVSIFDSEGTLFKEKVVFGTGNNARASGTYILELDDRVENLIDIASISIIFWTSCDYSGAFSIDNIYAISAVDTAVPEPTTNLLFCAGLTAFIAFRRIRGIDFGSLEKEKKQAISRN